MKIPDALFWTMVGMGLAAVFNVLGVQDSLRRAVCGPRAPIPQVYVQ